MIFKKHAVSLVLAGTLAAGLWPAQLQAASPQQNDAASGSVVEGYYSDMDKPALVWEKQDPSLHQLRKGSLTRNGNIVMAHNSNATPEEKELLSIPDGLRSGATVFSVRPDQDQALAWVTKLYTPKINDPELPAVPTMEDLPTEQEKALYYSKNSRILLQKTIELANGDLIAVGDVRIEKYETLYKQVKISADSNEFQFKAIKYGPEQNLMGSIELTELSSHSNGESTKWSIFYHMTPDNPTDVERGHFPNTSLVDGSTSDAVIVRMDQAGNVKSIASMGGFGEELITTVEPTADGGFVVLGTTTSVDGDFEGMADLGGTCSFLAKYDADGSKQWVRKLSGGAYHNLYSVKQLPDGGYVAAGNVQRGRLGTDEQHRASIQYPDTIREETALLIKFDAGGQMLWAQPYQLTTGNSTYLDAVGSRDGATIVAVGNQGWTGSETPPAGGGSSMSTSLKGAIAQKFDAATGQLLLEKTYYKPSDKLFTVQAEALRNNFAYVVPAPRSGYYLVGQASALNTNFDRDMLVANGDVKGGLDLVVVKSNDALEPEWFTFIGTAGWEQFLGFGNETPEGLNGLFALTEDGFVIAGGSSPSYMGRFTYDEDSDGIINSRDFYPLDPERSIPEGNYAAWLDLDRAPIGKWEQIITWKDIEAYPPSGSIYANNNISVDIPNAALASGDALLTIPVPVADRLFRGDDRYKPLVFSKEQLDAATTEHIGSLLSAKGQELKAAYKLSLQIGDHAAGRLGSKVKAEFSVSEVTYWDMAQLYAYSAGVLSLVDTAVFANQTVTFSTYEIADYAIAQVNDYDELAARNVRMDIAQLPAIAALTLQHQSIIQAIRLEYGRLVRQDLVTNLQDLIAAEARLLTLQAVHDAEAALPVAELIEQLPDTVRLAHEKQIADARTSYDLLSDAQKAYVPSASLDRLLHAEAALARLKAQQQQNAEAAAGVEHIIAALPLQISLSDAAAVAAARSAYQQLTSEQRGMVSAGYVASLDMAEQVLKQLQAKQQDEAAVAAVVELIIQLPEQISLADKEPVQQAKAAFNSLSEARKAMLVKADVNKLEAAVARIAELEKSGGGGGGGIWTGGSGGVQQQSGSDSKDQALDAGKLGKVVNEIRGKQAVARLTLEADKVREAIEQAHVERGGSPLVLSFEAGETVDRLIGSLPGSVLSLPEMNQAVLKFSTANASYWLPVDRISAEAAAAWGDANSPDEVSLLVELGPGTEDLAGWLAEMAEAQGFAIVAAPVEFHVKAVIRGQEKDIGQFNGYVERRFPLGSGEGAPVAIALEADGSFRPVPTRLEKQDGQWYAVASSRTNSTYAVIRRTSSFNDMANHWSRETVAALGDRMIIQGTETGSFLPDSDITRAEFAAILVRSLGLTAWAEGGGFNDVTPSDWYWQAVSAAIGNHLVSGYDDGQFKPEQRITREEAMGMIANAMKLTGLQSGELPADQDQTLSAYQDAALVSPWARDSIAAALAAGLTEGRGNGELAPGSNITRAEAAVLVYRLLIKSNLISQ